MFSIHIYSILVIWFRQFNNLLFYIQSCSVAYQSRVLSFGRPGLPGMIFSSFPLVLNHNRLCRLATHRAYSPRKHRAQVRRPEFRCAYVHNHDISRRHPAVIAFPPTLCTLLNLWVIPAMDSNSCRGMERFLLFPPSAVQLSPATWVATARNGFLHICDFEKRTMINT